MTIAFNARYMVEALQNMEAEQLAIELSGPLAPGVLKPVDDPAYVHVDHAGAHTLLIAAVELHLVRPSAPAATTAA